MRPAVSKQSKLGASSGTQRAWETEGGREREGLGRTSLSQSIPLCIIPQALFKDSWKPLRLCGRDKAQWTRWFCCYLHLKALLPEGFAPPSAWREARCPVCNAHVACNSCFLVVWHQTLSIACFFSTKLACTCAAAPAKKTLRWWHHKCSTDSSDYMSVPFH